MREIIDHLGNKWDLDNPETYSHLKDLDYSRLDERMFSLIGYSYCYINFFHPDWGWGKKSKDGGQKKRLLKLIKEFCDNRRDHYDDKQWYFEQIFLFECETENMC